MARKTKEERIAEQKALLDKAANSADKVERSTRASKPSVFGKNVAKDAQMKLELANTQIAEMTKQIEKLKARNTSPELIATLENEIKTLRSKATLDLDPSQVIVTRFANRDEIFFQTAEFFELMESIRENGQAIPITVRPSLVTDGFELISGRRRLEACLLLKINVVAILVEADDKKLTELQVLENFRDDLSHFEEADNFELMVSEGFFKSNTELAKTFSISEGKISQLRSISRIPEWLRKTFLIKINKVTRPLPSGEIKEVVELDIAPQRLCYELSKHIHSDFDLNNSKAIKDASEEILHATNFKDRVQKIITLIENKSLPSKQAAPLIERNKIRFTNKIVAETIKNNGSWQFKVPRKYNSEQLTSELETAVNNVLEKHFSGKD